eukprot:scaffold2638_cov19-Tisochrysis_lutea.AAC.2
MPSVFVCVLADSIRHLMHMQAWIVSSGTGVHMKHVGSPLGTGVHMKHVGSPLAAWRVADAAGLALDLKPAGV